MLRLARGFLGTQWRPSWVELPYRRDREAGQLEAYLDIPIRFDAGAIGIPLGEQELAQLALVPPERGPLLTYGDVVSAADGDVRNDDVAALQQIVQLRLLEGKSDIDGAASLAGLGLRTLQRRLARENLSYRQLLEDARLRRALALIRESRLPLSEIASMLGYEYPGNMTRAIRRATGQAPSALRAAESAGAA
jgi:AraC-like DNA-binding protein